MVDLVPTFIRKILWKSEVKLFHNLFGIHLKEDVKPEIKV